MQSSRSLFSRLTRPFSRHGLSSNRQKADLLSVGLQEKPPLYQRLPPWWTQWTYALVAADIAMTASAMEMSWNNWTTIQPGTKPTSSNPEDVPDTPPTPEHYVLRPDWQRFGLCTIHLGVGIGIATALIVTQSRYVRTFAVLPPLPGSAAAHSLKSEKKRLVTKLPGGKKLKPSPTVFTQPTVDDRRVFIQCASHWRTKGLTFPISDCSLNLGRNESEIILRVAGERGHWYIPLDNAVIHGQTMESRDEVTKKMGATTKSIKSKPEKEEKSEALRRVNEAKEKWMRWARLSIVKDWGNARRYGSWSVKDLEKRVRLDDASSLAVSKS